MNTLDVHCVTRVSGHLCLREDSVRAASARPMFHSQAPEMKKRTADQDHVNIG